MDNLRIYPYNMGSKGAKDLANLLGCKRVRDAGRYIPQRGQTVVGWGNSHMPSWMAQAQTRGVRILNKPSAINIAANKLSTFRALDAAGVSIPAYTTDIAVAQQWLQAGERVVERHNLRGASGEGIRIVSLEDEDTEAALQRAPLYTKYVSKSAEFRIHIFQGQLLDFVQKKRVASERRDETYSPYIASMERGWVFTRGDVPVSPTAVNLAVAAIRALGLDFGAVDMIYCDGRYYVLEVNSAPGLAGTTLVKYGNALRRLMGFGDLPESVTRQIMDQGADAPVRQVAANRPVSARRASVNRRRIERIRAARLRRGTASRQRPLLPRF